MTIIVNGSELSTGWMVTLGIAGAFLALMLILFVGVVWQAASQATDWFERENRRHRETASSPPRPID